MIEKKPVLMDKDTNFPRLTSESHRKQPSIHTPPKLSTTSHNKILQKPEKKG